MSVVGVGRHIQYIGLTNPEGIITMLKTLTAGEMCYTVSISFSKFSILAFYWRLFGVTNIRKLLIFVAAIVTGWMISVVCMHILIPFCNLGDEY